MSKSAFNTVLESNIKDNNNRFIRPSRHRTVLTTLRDFIGWLSESNVWSGENTWSGGISYTPEVITDISYTLTTDKFRQVFNGNANGSWVFPTGVNGQSYRITNATNFTLTLTGADDGGGSTQAILNADPFIIYPGQTLDVDWISGISKWVFK